MKAVAERFPQDLDVQTLYAESMMNINAWKLWSPDGKPAPGTEQIVATLQSVLARDPQHPGGNHYYVHALEASPHPEKAIAAAERLKSLAPAAAHLVHMPARISARDNEALVMALLDCAILVERRLDRALSNTRGISFSEYRLLRSLSILHGGTGMRVELADAVGLTPSAITRALKPLESNCRASMKRSPAGKAAIFTRSGSLRPRRCAELSATIVKTARGNDMPPGGRSKQRTHIRATARRRLRRRRLGARLRLSAGNRFERCPRSRCA